MSSRPGGRQAGPGPDPRLDDLVAHLGVHRNILYKTVGSKRGLYLVALRRHLADDVHPLTEALAAATGAASALRIIATADLGLLLLAAVERVSRCSSASPRPYCRWAL